MRSEFALAPISLLILVASAFGVGAADVDPCMNRLTLDDPGLCLNAQTLKRPEVCKGDEVVATKPNIDLVPVLAPPPAPGSKAQKNDIGEVLSAQAGRTPAAISCAQADACLSVFRFAGVMGSGFEPNKLPRTIALIKRVFSSADEDMAYAKVTFKRPRPFVTDHRVKKIVKQCPDSSYPSGHSTFAYVVAILLANMVPEKKVAIFARADQYAHNRVVAGVHYPSDVEAGRISASVIDYTLMEDRQFQEHYAAARSEVRAALGLSGN